MGKREKTTQKARTVYKIVIPAMVLLIALLYWLRHPDLSVQSLLSYTPENPLLTAGVLLLFYALKSMVVVFPIIVLEIAVGHLFPAGIAWLVNLAGVVISLTIPYWIGRLAGISAIKKMTERYPKFEEIITRQQSNSFFLSFFLRLVGGLPGDVVTMYLGATKIPYYQNLIGGVLGVLPRMTLATVLGSSIQDPGSPIFWISGGLTLVLSAASMGGYYHYRRSTQNAHVPFRQEGEG
ncbi:MAG: TVP38/TMEM64 family protein [Oscillospiraceae bacterium]